LGTVAGTLGTALENVRLYETERKRREEAESLREAIASLSTHIEIEPLLDQILDSVKRSSHTTAHPSSSEPAKKTWRSSLQKGSPLRKKLSA
jgi:GAF domain-containing protein